MEEAAHRLPRVAFRRGDRYAPLVTPEDVDLVPGDARAIWLPAENRAHLFRRTASRECDVRDPPCGNRILDRPGEALRAGLRQGRAVINDDDLASRPKIEYFVAWG